MEASSDAGPPALAKATAGLANAQMSPSSDDGQVGSAHSRDTLPAYRPWLAAGATCFAVQGLMFITSIAIYRHATSANVLYSSRGLWSVVAVWAIGHWFANREQHLGARVLVWRFIGAVLLMAAILMVLLDSSR
jgi:hypothetical protein